MSIRCDCGSFLQERMVRFKDIKTMAIVCPNCKFTSLTMEQAKVYQIKLIENRN